GLLLAVLAQSHTALQPFLSKCAVVLIDQEKTGTGVASHEDIGPAVLVEVPGNRRHGETAREPSDARHFADIAERAITVISVQLVEGRLEPARAAVHGNVHVAAE